MFKPSILILIVAALVSLMGFKAYNQISLFPAELSHWVISFVLLFIISNIFIWSVASKLKSTQI
ncbi:hypothetical protein XM47_13705 [Catenovulum maritimum]|uniref:Uncharacterized protein n=1 Tax=Catenovulum maritimum TaxID=1513271 RepID=A0A0J8GP24_9ALTE|nr:hypothetical protein XM47_13705 [Catenovulum maritimum]